MTRTGTATTGALAVLTAGVLAAVVGVAAWIGMAGPAGALAREPGAGRAAAGLPAWSVRVLSPADGSPVTAGARVDVRAVVSGPFLGGEGPEMPQPVAFLLAAGTALASQVVGTDGSVAFLAVPVRAVPYAVRVGPAPGVVTSEPFSLAVKAFGITSARATSGRLALGIATGNWSRGTPIRVTRDGRGVATVRVVARGRPVTALVADRPGVYQVLVATPSGAVLGRPPLARAARPGALGRGPRAWHRVVAGVP